MLRTVFIVLVFVFAAIPVRADELDRVVAQHTAPGFAAVSPAAQTALGGARNEGLRKMMTENPARGRDFLNPIVNALLDPSSQSHLADYLSLTTLLLDRPVVRYPRSSPLARWVSEAQQPDSLAALLKAIQARFPENLLNSYPRSLRRVLYVILAAQMNANSWVNTAQESAMDAQRLWTVKELYLFEPYEVEFKQRVEYRSYTKALQNFNPAPLLVAASDLFMAAEWSIGELIKIKAAPRSARIETAYGPILIGGKDTDRYGAEPSLLIIDFGGDDSYAQAGSNDPAIQATSLSIDLAGDDSYSSATDRPSFGAGTLGIGLLWDETGSDRYSGTQRSQGSAQFGVGILVDRGGADIYSAEFESQGSALAGVGLLIDTVGDDRYESFSYSQSFAGPGGAALLFDRAGNDVYLANDREVRYPAPQDKAHNVSMSQGAASGIRPFKKGALSLSGGGALLLDGAGDDRYSAGVFGQGVGYWYALGALIDAGGMDTYSGHWYVQGASAHFASGVLWDFGGDDSYHCEVQMALGSAHDVGSALFADEGGDDSYEAKRLALGSSNAAGWGIFFDGAGNDRYTIGKESCAWISGIEEADPRAKLSRGGVCVDVSGTDSLVRAK